MMLWIKLSIQWATNSGVDARGLKVFTFRFDSPIAKFGNGVFADMWRSDFLKKCVLQHSCQHKYLTP